jgi:hypothetical protein
LKKLGTRFKDFYEPSQQARDDGIMELSTRNGFGSKANIGEKSLVYTTIYGHKFPPNRLDEILSKSYEMRPSV